MKRSWPQGTKLCQVGGLLGVVVALQSICLMYLSVLQWHKNLPLHSNKEHLLTWSMCAHVWSSQIKICSIKTSTKLYMHTIIKQRIKFNIVSHYAHCLHKLHIKIIVKLTQEKKKKIVICTLAVDLQNHVCDWNQLMEPVGIIISYSVKGVTQNSVSNLRSWQNDFALEKGPHLHNNCGNCLDLLFMRTVVRKCHCCHT